MVQIIKYNQIKTALHKLKLSEYIQYTVCRMPMLLSDREPGQAEKRHKKRELFSFISVRS